MKRKILKPIYDFSLLQNFLVEKGFIVEQTGYRKIHPEKVTVNAISRGEIEFTDSGIYLIGEDGEKQQVYLYKRHYKLIEHGKPRFHICKCATIKHFLNAGILKDEYVRANSDPVPVFNLDMDKEELVSNLPLCKYCSSIAREYVNVYSSDFVDKIKREMKKNENMDAQELDIFGYTRSWDEISRLFRESHNYTCEECGLHIEDVYDRQYIHCHHIDKNKLNNSESNLKCLCLRCHSLVDEGHKRNLTTGANKIVFEDFERKYPMITKLV